MVGAERRQNTTQGAEGGKADRSDPAEGGGGGAVNRPEADPVGGRTPGRRSGGDGKAEAERLERRAVGALERRSHAWKGGRSERPSGEQSNACKGGRLVGASSKQILLGAKAESLYITLIILQG